MTPKGQQAVKMRGLFGGETEERATAWVQGIESEAIDIERERLVGFVRALINEATKTNGDRRDNHWLDEVVADIVDGGA